MSTSSRFLTIVIPFIACGGILIHHAAAPRRGQAADPVPASIQDEQWQGGQAAMGNIVPRCSTVNTLAPAAAGASPAPNPAPPPATTQPDSSANLEMGGDSLPAAGGRRIIRMEVTAYCPCEKCCGKSDGITASGHSVWENNSCLVAADTRALPFGTMVCIPGYNAGRPVPVWDRGGAIKGDRLDVFFPSHRQALIWGRQWLDVVVMDKPAGPSR